MSAQNKLTYIQLCRFALLARHYISSGDGESALKVIESIESALSTSKMSWGYSYFMQEKAHLLSQSGELDKAIDVLQNRVRPVYPTWNWYQSMISRKISTMESQRNAVIAN